MHALDGLLNAVERPEMDILGVAEQAMLQLLDFCIDGSVGRVCKGGLKTAEGYGRRWWQVYPVRKLALQTEDGSACNGASCTGSTVTGI